MARVWGPVFGALVIVLAFEVQKFGTLVEAASVIRGCARETDVVARFGGDEFALVLPETSREGAIAVANRIKERLGSTEFLKNDGLSVQANQRSLLIDLPLSRAHLGERVGLLIAAQHLR